MKKLVAFLLLAAMAAALCACAPSSSQSVPASESISQSKKPGNKIALCMGSINHPVHRTVQLGFIEGAEESGLETPLISGLTEGSSAELIEKWRSDVASNGITGVALYTGDDACYELLREWHDAGLKTVVPMFCHSYEYTHGFIDADVCTQYDYAIREKSPGSLAADYILAELFSARRDDRCLRRNSKRSGRDFRLCRKTLRTVDSGHCRVFCGAVLL